MLKPADELVPISDSTLEAALSSSPGARFYQLVDALLSGAPDSQQRLRQWFALEPDTYRLLAVLTRRLLDILALSRGEKPGSPFLVRQLRALARHWPPPRLGHALTELARLEHELKSGLIPGETARQAELSALQLLTAALASGG
jgi:DNA polymerase III delta subunit